MASLLHPKFKKICTYDIIYIYTGGEFKISSELMLLLLFYTVINIIITRSSML